MTDPERFVTAQGYFAGVFKVLLSAANTKNAEFHKFLSEGREGFIFPMARGLSAANATCLRELLGNPAAELAQLQGETLTLLIRTHTRPAEAGPLDEFAYKNAIWLLERLMEDKRMITVGLSPSNSLADLVRPSEATGSTDSLRVMILAATYLAGTEQLGDAAHLPEILAAATGLGSRAPAELVQDTLNLTKSLLKEKYFESLALDQLMFFLVGVIEAYPFADVLHFACFEVLGLLLSSLQKHSGCEAPLIAFVLNSVEQSREPSQSSKKFNKVSFDFTKQLVCSLDLARLADEAARSALSELKPRLKQWFRKFDVESDSTQPVSNMSSVVQAVREEELAPFAQQFDAIGPGSPNYWKDWSSGSPSPTRDPGEELLFSPNNPDLRKIKTDSVSLSNLEARIILNEDSSPERNKQFNVGSIERFEDDDLLDNELLSPKNSGLFVRERDFRNDSFAQIVHPHVLQDSFDSLTKK